MRHPIIQPSWLFASVLVVAGAHAGEQVAPAAVVDDSASANQIVSIDQATGQLRAPTAAERQQLQQAAKASNRRQAEPRLASKKGFVAPASESAAMASKRQLSNGGTSMQVPESYMSHLTVSRDSSGQLHIQHQDEHATATNDNSMEADHE
ncbi:post-PEP-CTERM-1 domain-containing protein [Pseudoxanthomonas dokdonensis]|uniref:DUF4148 domain-containing protein n=1 Tax=Pseudoxanthomonas dokdonensis TaxID=344882 RepID=A0A0R0CF25_9GAMM|nr:hypothetical protein [Pseudoxanthomonas dokdonensis]KRG68335.1 hypothetical protein ABB29_13530 [Pseudoxanthomonas dokdonensis]